MNKLLTTVLCVLIYSFLSAQSNDVCECQAGTSKERQQRSGAKHETDASKYALKKKFISVKDVYKWQGQFSSITKNIKTDPRNKMSLRQHDTPEDTLYTLKGYMWFVKVEDNDCDMHIEIGDKSSSATRIVVEVPRENLALQKKIKKQLDDRDLPILGCGTSNAEKAHFPKGLQVLVAGLGFYDASHKPNTNHGDSHTKKYSWELHPVVDITFL
jgi:hypothetical protein